MPTPSQRSQAAASDATARATLAGQTSERERMRAARAEAAAALADGEARLGKTSELAALRSSAERYDALAADVPARRAGLATAHSALKDRVDQLTRLEQEIAGQQLAHDSLVAQAGAAASLDSARAHLDQAATAMVEALRRRDIAMDSVRAADAHLLATRALHEQSIQAAQAAHLRSGLHPGDDCPICGGPIGFLPGLGAPENDTTTALRVAEADAMDAHRELAARQAELSGSEGRRAEAETAAEAARSALPTGDLKSRASAIDLEAQASKLADEMRTTGTRVQSEREAVTREAGRIHEIAAQVERDTREIDQLAAALEQHGGRDRVGTIVSSLAELAGLAERVNEADRELLAVESSVAEAERLVSGVEATLIRPLRLAAAAAAQSADLIPPGSDLSAEALDAACEALDRRLVERAAALEVEFTDLRQQSATELVWLTEQTAAAGLAGPEDIPRATERAKTDHVTAQSDLARAVERAMQSRRRLRDAAEARAQAERFRVVALDLRADRFPRFLLQRYRERLAVAASERLQDLSRGAYRFAAAEPDPLAIVDTRRGEATRSVATLSGGERFLASLSLALALGDIAAGAGGRLDCLFLDEGFSTLDADSLELAIAGIERLSGGGRLIGVITHLPGVAERLGAAIRVVKDPTGVSRVMRDALAA